MLAVWVSAFCVFHSFLFGVQPSRYLHVCVYVLVRVFTLGSQSPLGPLALWAFVASLCLSPYMFLSKCWIFYKFEIYRKMMKPVQRVGMYSIPSFPHY